MYQEFFLQKGMLILPLVALMSFILSFVAILWWSLRAARQPLTQLDKKSIALATNLSAPNSGADASVIRFA